MKIGFLAPLTGGAAQIGRDMVNGFEMYLDEAGGQIAGRKVEVIVEDTAGQPRHRHHQDAQAGGERPRPHGGG
jgi:branched-chain amino acid transport system substrate-binding protein